MSNEKQEAGSKKQEGVMALGMKVGIGAALLAAPLGSALVFLHLKDASDQKNHSEEMGAAYDASAVGKIDPAAIKYVQSATIATGLKYARAVAVDAAGRVMVAGDRKVRILGADGAVSEIALPDYPTCVAAGESGTVIVGFREHVEVYGADGKRVKAWESFGSRAQVTGLAVRGQEVFVADAGRRMVVRCDLDGKVLGELGQRDPSRGQEGLVLPSAFLNVSLAADGQLLINNPGRHRVETWSSDGEVQKFWGTAGAGLSGFIGCCNPSHLAVMADGRIITAEKGVARVKVYKANGELDAVVAGPEVLGSGAHGFELAVDKENGVLVLEPGATEIRVFTEKPVARSQKPEGRSSPQFSQISTESGGGGR